MSTRKQQLNELIKDKDFRREFVSSYVQEMLAGQIKAIRDHNQWSQGELGVAADGMKQAQVSRLENPNYSGATVNSLSRLANAFDLGLIVSFVRLSEFVDRIVMQSPLELVPPNYDEEQQQMSFVDVSVDSANWISLPSNSVEVWATDAHDHFSATIEPAISSSSSGAEETITAKATPQDAKSAEGERDFALAA